jgi:lipopolysaccharide transport system ATP-binding protein
MNIRGKEDPYLKIGEINDRTSKGISDYIWALKDINLDVKQGEVLGIIGKNGAGKSTLLKILSKVTSPTTGSIKANGRIASLLEVGTGFHSEMTGRENIYLNGAILGMNKEEIKSKLDEIVDFSGVERYIDTPVKRYSSGMLVRLGFAVAAHLDPEILVVDEVLAVGDAEFQKKAVGKMQDISKGHGRTVLFVSHSMGSIAQLCPNVVLLKDGRVEKIGSSDHVISHYLEYNSKENMFYKNGVNIKDIGITKVFTMKDNLNQCTGFTHKERINIVTLLKINKWINNIELRIIFRDILGKAIFTSDLTLEEKMIKDGHIEITAEIPPNFLRPGKYLITVATFVPHKFHIELIKDIFTIYIIDGGSKYAQSEELDYGYIFFNPKWHIKTSFSSKQEI